jgi:DNA modification methylase
VIDTDVVRENAQTYRLGWTENSKDGTKQGIGSLEYVLIFRKWNPSMSTDDPPTANGPHPVTKDKTQYLKSRWQIHASGIWRSNGNELLTPEKVSAMGVKGLYHWWQDYCQTHGYDYPTHVQYCEMVDKAGLIPTSMMLFAPHSANPDIWTDVQRINTLNTALKQKENDSHVCPLQLDVIERLLERYTNKGDLVLDPFGGVMSVPYVATKMRRRAIGIELNWQYWKYGCQFCERLEREMYAPTLFDMLEESAA